MILTKLQSILFLVPFIELIVLYFLSRKLFNQLARLFQSIISKTKWIYYSLAFLFLPGTYIHELSHYVMAKILFVPVYGFSLRPKIFGNELRLGHVEVAKSDFVRRFFIGIAPILFGITILIGSVYLLILFNKTHKLLYIIGEGILVFEIANTMFMSKKDMEGSWKVWMSLLFITMILYLLGIQVQPIVNVFQSNNLFFTHISEYLIVPIILNSILIGCIRFCLYISES
jgi:hypothetical protein